MLDTLWPLLHAPIYINWHLTYRCFLNCKHCYSRARPLDHEISLEKQFQIADNIVRNNIFYVNFGGGEPLCSESLFPLVKKLSDAGVFVNVSTNGINITSEIADKLVQNGIGGIIVSMDSAKPEVHDQIRNCRGAYSQMMNCVKYFGTHNIPVRVSTVITKANLYEMEAILDQASVFGCAEIELKRMKLVGNARNAADLLLTKEDEDYLYANVLRWQETYPTNIHLIYSPTHIPGIDTGCPCGKSVLTILDNGDISACAYSPTIIGNALRDDLGEIWRNSEELHDMRSKGRCPGLEI